MNWIANRAAFIIVLFALSTACAGSTNNPGNDASVGADTSTGTDGAASLDGAPNGSDGAATGRDGSVVAGDAARDASAPTNETAENAIELNPLGQEVMVSVPSVPGGGRTLYTRHFKVPYVRGRCGLILTKRSGAGGGVQVAIHPDARGGALGIGINGCIANLDSSCGIEINFDYLAGPPPAYAYIEVGQYFAADYTLELVALAQLGTIPTPTPTGYVRIKTLWEATLETPGSPTIAYGTPTTVLQAQAGPVAGAGLTYFQHLGNPNAICWIRDNEDFEHRVDEDVAQFSWLTPTRTLALAEPPTRGAVLNHTFPGAAWSSAEMGSLGLRVSPASTITTTEVTTPTFTGPPRISLNVGSAIQYDYSAFSGADELYMRFDTSDRRLVECRLPVTGTPSTVDVLTRAMGKDFQARGVQTPAIEVGICRRLAGNLTLASIYNSTALTLVIAMCHSLRVTAPVIEHAF